MEFSDLSHEQRIALVALMEAVTMANTAVSEGEQREIAVVAEALGDEEYRGLLEEADRRFTDIDSLKTFLQTVDDKGAQELIYGTVWEASMAEPNLKPLESDLLDWLAQTWGISRESPQ